MSSIAVSLRVWPPPFSCPGIQPKADDLRSLLSSDSSIRRLALKRAAASRTPRYHLPAFFGATVRTTVSTPNANGVCTVDPSVARNTLRSSKRNPCQVSAARPISGPPRRSSSQTSPDSILASCVGAPRPPRRRSFVYG